MFITAIATSSNVEGTCAASTSTNSKFLGFLVISFTVINSPSLTSIKPCFANNLSALASLVESFGTATLSPFFTSSNFDSLPDVSIDRLILLFLIQLNYLIF